MKHSDPTSLPTVAVTRRSLPGSGIGRLARHARVVAWQAPGPPGARDLARIASSADALLCIGLDRIDSSVIEQCGRLRAVATASVGYDNLDLAALSARRIPASNTPGVLAETTADLTWALILAASRRVVEADRLVRAGGGRVQAFDLLLGQDVHGAVLGIIGYGAIGQAVARRAAGFDMRVVHHDVVSTAHDDRLSRWTPLDDLLRTADIVSVHASLTPGSRHLIGERELGLMKSTAILVNAARGQIVDQPALVRALTERRIFAAGLDVTEVEPIPLDDPLLALPNCVVLPHIGSATEATRARMVDIAVDNIVAGLEGDRLPNCVNPEVYE